MAISKSVKARIAAAKACADKLEAAAQNLRELEALEKGWAALVKNRRLRAVDWQRMFSFFGKDSPVDMAKIWNWMVQVDRKECWAFHRAVAVALKSAISQQRDELTKLSKTAASC